MKQLIFTLCLLFPYCVNAQIGMDKVEDDGRRFIMSETMSLYTGLTNGGSFFLGYSLFNNTDEYYYLSLILNEGKTDIDRGRKLLIKLKDGTSMELSNTKEIGPENYDLRTNVNGRLFYLTSPSYSISENELKRLIEGEAIKVRVETNVDFFDRDIKKNKLSKGLKTAYEAIQKKKITKNELYEGF